MKQCITCLEIKQYNEYYYRKDLLKHRNSCKTCEKSRVIKYYQENKSKCSSAAKKYYKKNCNAIRQKSKEWYHGNKEKAKIRAKKYHHKNIEKIRPLKAAAQKRRETLKKQSCPTWLTKEHIIQMKNIYKEAAKLSKLTGVKYHVDHIIPLQADNVCGLHVPWNLQILEATENLKKSNKVLDKFL